MVSSAHRKASDLTKTLISRQKFLISFHIVFSARITMIFEKKKLLDTKYAFRFSQQLPSETFLILSRIQPETIKMSVGINVKCPLFVSDFNKP